MSDTRLPLRETRGFSLRRYIDLDQERQIRAWLRQPKRAKPGLTHSLHYLWDAYTKLEAEHRALLDRQKKAKAALDA